MFWTSHNLPRKVMWGLFWVLLGAALLMANHGLFGYNFSFSRDWPVILIAVGVMKLVDLLAWRRDRRFGCCSRVIIGREGETKGDGGPAKSEILKAVEEGRMSADEAANRLKNL